MQKLLLDLITSPEIVSQENCQGVKIGIYSNFPIQQLALHRFINTFVSKFSKYENCENLHTH